MTTQEPRTGVQVEPLSEEEERELRAFAFGRGEPWPPSFPTMPHMVRRLLAALASKSGSETVPVVREGLDEAWAAAEAAVAAAGDSFQVHGYEEPEWRGLFTIESRHTDPNAVSAMAGGPGFITEPVRIFRKPLIEGLHELAAFYVARLNEDARHGK